jgi:glycosyltransferase involved in cell wall biosynthesis
MKTRNMRICYDYQIFSMETFGGISRYFVELASRLHKYPGTDVRIIAPLYRSKLLAAKSHEIPVLGFPFTGQIRGAVRITKRVSPCFSRVLSWAYKPDIVHETYYSRNRTSSSSAKTVLTVHDFFEDMFPELYPKWWRKTMEHRKDILRRADHLICISECTRADLMRLYEVDPDRISVVHHASSLTAPIAPVAAMGEPFFLYVGHRYAIKNFHSLLAAFAESLSFKTHKLVCLGGSQITEEEQTRVKELGIPPDRIVQVGGGNDDLLSRYYASAEAFVYPSLYEGFGIPLLEAMECGCPIICSNAGSIPEVAGDAVIYFDPKDIHSISNAMLRVAQSPSERRQLIMKGKVRCKQFSWDKCAQQTYSVYARLLDRL